MPTLFGGLFTDDLLREVSKASVVCIAAAGVWAVDLKRQETRKPLPYGFVLLTGAGLTTLAIVVAFTLLLPPEPFR